MADIAEINGVATADIAELNGKQYGTCAELGGGALPSQKDPCWVAVSDGGRVMYSTAATPTSGTWTGNDYFAPDKGAPATAIAYGLDNLGNDHWIITWDRGNNCASVSTSSVPHAEHAWATLDLDQGVWDAGKVPNDVAFSSAPSVAGTGKSGLWVIVGNGGRIAYSSTGSADHADWEVDINTTAGFAGNRHPEAVCFSGSFVFVAGSRTRIVSASIPTDWANGTNLAWNTGDLALDENDSNGNSQFNWKRIAAGGSGTDARFFTVADSSRDTNFPMFATGANATEGDPCCGDYSGGNGWRDIGGAPAQTFGDNTNSSSRRMMDVATDGSGNWMIVGRNGTGYKSINNGATWTTMTLPDNSNGQAIASNDILCVEYALVNGANTWIVGGEDGYIAVSTDVGANWTICDNPWAAGGVGVNHHVHGIAANYIPRHPGVT
tara:strand:+ start:2711 stop:4021 length:1311 start_codon:yes stop_codon:yes gene_type:complete